VPRAIATTLAMTLSARMMLGTEAGRRASKMIVADIDVWRVANMISSRATDNEQGEREMARENP
jgi:hypothetical protein